MKNRINILIVENNKIQAGFIESIFDPAKYDISTISNGKAAYEHLAKTKQRDMVVLISYHLPSMTGIEVMKKLREQKIQIAFVFLTANKTVEAAVEAMKAGAYDFIPKTSKLHVELPPMVDKAYIRQQEQIERERIKEELLNNRIRLQTIMNSVQSGIMLINAETHKITNLNPAAAKIIGLPEKDILNQSCFTFFPNHEDGNIQFSSQNEIKNFETSIIINNNKKLPVLETIIPVDLKGEEFYVVNFVDISKQKLITEKLTQQNAEIYQQKEEIEAQRDQLEIQRDYVIQQRDQIQQQKKEITDSIHYARRIQRAVLPPDEYINHILPEHFIFYLPRDIVSGDFFWVAQKNNQLIAVVADCTGHGVPGGFMSMLGIAFLNEIVNKFEHIKANQILNELRLMVIKSLKQTGKRGEAKDGMDIGACIIDSQKQSLQYAGAHIPLYLVRKNNDDTEQKYRLVQIKPDRMPISIHKKAEKSFTNRTIHFEHNDTIYMFSDGYVDQFGGSKGRKFLAKNFKKLLTGIQDVPMNEQKAILEEQFQRWKGEHRQIDDILVMGIRLSDFVLQSPDRQYDWSNKTILIAEDLEENYTLIEEYLSGTNAKIIWAKNGRMAVNHCKQDKSIDIVLMDLQMPEMNGYEAIQEIRKFDKHLPVIVQTAYSMSGEKEKSFKAGCDNYISKPINQKELLATMNKYI